MINEFGIKKTAELSLIKVAKELQVSVHDIIEYASKIGVRLVASRPINESDFKKVKPYFSKRLNELKKNKKKENKSPSKKLSKRRKKIKINSRNKKHRTSIMTVYSELKKLKGRPIIFKNPMRG